VRTFAQSYGKPCVLETPHALTGLTRGERSKRGKGWFLADGHWWTATNPTAGASSWHERMRLPTETRADSPCVSDKSLRC
jgi:hypothetical protein